MIDYTSTYEYIYILYGCIYSIMCHNVSYVIRYMYIYNTYTHELSVIDLKEHLDTSSKDEADTFFFGAPKERIVTHSLNSRQ
jgi:hypothetical protein